MFCPNCGAESVQGLNFCKHCGTGLSEADNQPPASRNVFAAFILAAAIVAIVLGGIAIVFNFTLSLVGPQPPGYTPAVHDAIAVAMAMVTFGSTAILFATFLLIRLFSRMMGIGTNMKSTRRPKQMHAAPGVAQIHPPPLSMQSVTEHTTRNFEPRGYQRDTSE